MAPVHRWLLLIQTQMERTPLLTHRSEIFQEVRISSFHATDPGAPGSRSVGLHPTERPYSSPLCRPAPFPGLVSPTTPGLVPESSPSCPFHVNILLPTFHFLSYTPDSHFPALESPASKANSQAQEIRHHPGTHAAGSGARPHQRKPVRALDPDSWNLEIL